MDDLPIGLLRCQLPIAPDRELRRAHRYVVQVLPKPVSGELGLAKGAIGARRNVQGTVHLRAQTENAKDHCLHAGADRYLERPIHLVRLHDGIVGVDRLRKVGEVLGPPSTARQGIPRHSIRAHAIERFGNPQRLANILSAAAPIAVLAVPVNAVGSGNREHAERPQEFALFDPGDHPLFSIQRDGLPIEDVELVAIEHQLPAAIGIEVLEPPFPFVPKHLVRYLLQLLGQRLKRIRVAIVPLVAPLGQLSVVVRRHEVDGRRDVFVAAGTHFQQVR